MFKSKLILATSLVLAASGAFADSGDVPLSEWSSSASTVTREQVIQEMREAYARGDRDYGERGYEPAKVASTPRSRAEVVAEMLEAMRLGLIPGGEADIPVATAEQERLIAKAGRDAAEEVAKAAAAVKVGQAKP